MISYSSPKERDERLKSSRRISPVIQNGVYAFAAMWSIIIIQMLYFQWVRFDYFSGIILGILYVDYYRRNTPESKEIGEFLAPFVSLSLLFFILLSVPLRTNFITLSNEETETLEMVFRYSNNSFGFLANVACFHILECINDHIRNYEE